MASGAAEILARALEREADAQEAGSTGDLHQAMQVIRREIMPINDIPRPIFNLTLKFWKQWANAAQNQWRYQGSIAADDWPRMARILAQSVRQGTMPNDPEIIEHFIRRKAKLSWRDMKSLFDESD